MSERITAANLDEVIAKNEAIEKEHRNPGDCHPYCHDIGAPAGQSDD